MAEQRMFPIQSQRGAAPHPLRIPWSVAEKAYSVYSGEYGRGQSLERLAERGGFGPNEMDDFCPGWRDECSEIMKLRAEIAAARAAVDGIDIRESHISDNADPDQLRAMLLGAGLTIASLSDLPQKLKADVERLRKLLEEALTHCGCCCPQCVRTWAALGVLDGY